MLAGHVGHCPGAHSPPPMGCGYLVVDRCAGRPYLAEGSRQGALTTTYTPRSLQKVWPRVTFMSRYRGRAASSPAAGSPGRHLAWFARGELHAAEGQEKAGHDRRIRFPWAGARLEARSVVCRDTGTGRPCSRSGQPERALYPSLLTATSSTLGDLLGLGVMWA